MDAVEEGRQARRAEERAQRDQQPAAPVLYSILKVLWNMCRS